MRITLHVYLLWVGGLVRASRGGLVSSGTDAFEGWVVRWLLALQSSVLFWLRADLVGGHISTSFRDRGLCKVCR